MLQSSPLFQLYQTRLRDFYRQPARIFWVYGFPTVLAVILGLAFQNRPPAPIQADLVKGPFSSAIEQAIKMHNDRVSSSSKSSAPSSAAALPAVTLRTVPELEA